MNLFRLFRCEKAVAAIEFALVVPILSILFLGGFELTRYVLIYQKLSKTAASMSDLISRSDKLSEADISNTFNAVQWLMAPYYEENKVRVIVSSIMDDGTGNLVNWQRCGGGTLVDASELGTQGSYVTLPNTFDLKLNEDTIVAEVHYDYTSIIGIDIIANDIVIKTRFTKPRLGALTEITDNAGATGC